MEAVESWESQNRPGSYANLEMAMGSKGNATAMTKSTSGRSHNGKIHSTNAEESVPSGVVFVGIAGPEMKQRGQ